MKGWRSCEQPLRWPDFEAAAGTFDYDNVMMLIEELDPLGLQVDWYPDLPLPSFEQSEDLQALGDTRGRLLDLLFFDEGAQTGWIDEQGAVIEESLASLQRRPDPELKANTRQFKQVLSTVLDIRSDDALTPDERIREAGELMSRLSLPMRMRQAMMARCGLRGDPEFDAAFNAYKQAKGRIFSLNRGPCLFIALWHRWWARAPLDALYEAASAGMARAVEMMDPERGYVFFTYARHWVQKWTVRACCDLRGIPMRYLGRSMWVERHLLKTGHSQSPRALGAALDLSEEEAEFYMALLEEARPRRRGEPLAVERLIRAWEERGQ
ncbi:MAG: hypothetical protein ACE366_04855 [Bradymonadia bacterium]